MEIEKKRETSWKIQLSKTDEYIELTSVEISGEVRMIKLALFNKDNSIKVNMNKEEFFKFLSLIAAFKDVVIGDEAIILDNNLNIIENRVNDTQDYSKIKQELYQINHDSSEESIKNDDTEELNPEEWDPW
jgi:hypothetical protein